METVVAEIVILHYGFHLFLWHCLEVRTHGEDASLCIQHTWMERKRDELRVNMTLT